MDRQFDTDCEVTFTSTAFVPSNVLSNNLISLIIVREVSIRLNPCSTVVGQSIINPKV
jgi:hypothetical protein